MLPIGAVGGGGQRVARATLFAALRYILMKKMDPDEVALRLLCEKAEDRLERVEAGSVAIERYSRLGEEAIAKLVRDQQARQVNSCFFRQSSHPLPRDQASIYR